MKSVAILASVLAAALGASFLAAQVKPTDEKVPCRDYKDVLALFDRLGYTQKAWHAVIHIVPAHAGPR